MGLGFCLFQAWLFQSRLKKPLFGWGTKCLPKFFAFLPNMSAPRADVLLMAGLFPIVALTDFRYFHDLWAHLIPIFYHRIWSCTFNLRGGKIPVIAYIKSAPDWVSLFFFFQIWYVLFLVKWLSFFLKRVHAVRITPLHKKTLQYQWNTATSGQKPGKQVNRHAVKCVFLISKRLTVQLKSIYIIQPFDIQSFKLFFLAGRECMLVLSVRFR